MNQEQFRGARVTQLRVVAREGGSIAVAEPMTADEITKLFEDYVARCGGAHGSAQERAFTAATPALADQCARRERRDRRWLIGTLLTVVVACAAAVARLHWIAQ